MQRRHLLWLKSFFAAILLILALVRWFFFGLVSQRMDSVFLLLITGVFLVFLIPWERLTGFKAAGIIELSLDRPEVRAALKALSLEKVEDQELREKLEVMSSEIERANGGRILWIDDKPLEIYAERRFLRALGIQTITATSSEEAKDILRKDNDFDIIITDARRGDDNLAGAGFIIELREGKDPIIGDDPVIRSLPVIFYGIRWPWNSLLFVTKSARKWRPKEDRSEEELPKVWLSQTPQELIVKVLRTLAEIRAEPIKSKSSKGREALKQLPKEAHEEKKEQ